MCNTLPSIRKIKNLLHDYHSPEKHQLLDSMRKLPDTFTTLVSSKKKPHHYMETPHYERRSDRVSVALRHSPEHRPSREADDYLALQIIDEQYRNPSAMIVAPGDDGFYEVYARTIVSFRHEHLAEVKIVFDEPSWLHSDLSKNDVDEALTRHPHRRRQN